jgi:hypothetical protein
MNHSSCRPLLLSLFAFFIVATPLTQAQWTPPTPEELSMTSQAEVPGAAAVCLFHEEVTEDSLHMWSTYVRLKVLTDHGKEYSNVELKYAGTLGTGGYTVEDIQGRTIHADGTIIPFTGKPYEKLIEKNQGVKFMAKVFTLPDVEVGSIIEYRYKLRYDDNWYMSPTWLIQTDLFTRRAHYVWKPTDKELITNDDRGQITNHIFWTPILPAGAEVKRTQLPSTVFSHEGQNILDLEVHDVPPAPEEDYMPPIGGLTYRVLFFYSPYRTSDEFWKSESKYWGKQRDKFIGPGQAVTAAVHDLVLPTDTPDQKLRKLYAAVMKLENTSFTREHSSSEEKAQGLKEVHTTDDIWTRKRGSDDQLTELFVAMARAAGMKAYLATVTDRDRSVFLKTYLSLRQFDDYIAIVNVDGKEQYFDPGSRYCPYEHLAWKHTIAGGIRQLDGGVDLFFTPNEPYTQSRTMRVADLTIDQHGAVSGGIKITYIGAPALHWRQRSLVGDTESLEHEIRSSIERILPPGLEVNLTSIQKLDDYEEPLVVNFETKGVLGSSTGKRVLLPSDIFVSTTPAAFPNAKRTIPVYFDYSHMTQDAVRINFPPGFSIESIPVDDQTRFQQFALCTTKIASTPTSFTTHRDFALGESIFKVDEYPELRSFYSKMEDRDKQTVVLTAAKSSPAGN